MLQITFTNDIINMEGEFMKKKSYKVISLFSGAGGMDIGFINSGFEIVWANDFFKEAVESYRNNIGDHIVYGDITK